MILRFAVAILFAGGVFCWGGPKASAQPVSLNPVADAFVFSDEPTFNYGGGGVFTISAPGLPQGEFQSLLRFDLAGAKSQFDLAYGAGNWTLASAALQLSASSPNNPIFNDSAAGQFSATWMQNDSWGEGNGAPTTPDTNGVTWNSLPSFLSAGDQNLGVFSFNGATTGSANYSLLLAPGFVSDATSGGLASVHLRAAPGDTTVSGAFNSRTFNQAVRRPLLTLNAVAIPEPSTWALAACGVVGLGLLRRGWRNGRA
jgi:hypothetical protein